MERIGKYEILHELGQGGMGIVYKARDPVIDRDVAVKVVQDHILDTPTLRERFYREARSAGRLSHPNITTLYDIGEEEGAPYLVMEFLGGTDLGTLIRRNASFTLQEKIEIGIQICRGLQYAHQNNVIHRDIKPDNIRLLAGNRVKIMDFGIARLDSETRTLTKEGIGTPRYMSPEQIRGDALDGRTDIFSFGVLFYELLTGTSPFDGDRVTTVIYKILHEEPPPIKLDATPLANELQRIVARCLAKDPSDRYADFSAVRNDLSSLIGSSTHPTRTLTHTATPNADQASPSGAVPAASSYRSRYIAFGLLAVLALTAGGYALFAPLSSLISSSSVEPFNQRPPEPQVTAPSPSDTAYAEPNAARSPSRATDDEPAIPQPSETDESLAADSSLQAASDDEPSEEQPTEDASQPDAPAPASTALRATADDAQRTMTDARNRAMNRGDASTTPLFQQAESARMRGDEQYQAGDFEIAARTFQQAGSLYVAAEQDAAEQAAAENDRMAQRTRASRDAAQQAQASMQRVKSAVTTGRQHHATYQQALDLEAEATRAFESDSYPASESLYTEAAALYERTNTLPTRTEDVQRALDTLLAQCKQAFEQEDIEALRALSSFYESWTPFFDVTHDITATLTTERFHLGDEEATATIHFQLEYQDNKNRTQQNQFTHSWTLRQRDLQWVLIDVVAE